MRELRRVVSRLGYTHIDIEQTGGDHLRVVAHRPDGTVVRRIVSLSPSDPRTILNVKADFKRHLNA